MKQLLAVACCLLLTGCGGLVFPEPGDGARMQSTGQTYAPEGEGGYAPPLANERMTSTCTMQGQGAVCR